MSLSVMSLRRTRLSSLFGVSAIFCGLLGSPARGQALDLLKYTPLPESDASPDVQKELRQRVVEFFQFSQNKEFRKAMKYVADETQDSYLADAKMDIKKFAITDVHFSADFKRAAVGLDVARTLLFETDALVLTLPMSTSWKLEDGKWVWFRDATLEQKNPVTAMFKAAPDQPAAEPRLVQQAADGTIKLPENFGDPNNMAGAALAILSKKGGFDKNIAKLTTSKESEDKVVFHNVQQGYINLELGPAPPIPGLTVTVNKDQVGPNEDAVLLFKYTPPVPVADGPPVAPPYPFDAKLVLQPFQQSLVVHVTFEP